MNLSEIVLGPFVFSTGGLFLLLGVLFSAWMVSRTVHEKNLSLRFINDHFLIYLLVSLVIGRTGAIVHIWPTIEEKMVTSGSFIDSLFIFVRDGLSFWHGGIDFTWAVIGFLVTFLFMCFKNNENTLSWLDAFSLPLLLFLIFLELGSFFAGWNYGSPVDETFLFAISYDMTDVRYSGYIHPVQLYGAILFFIVFLIGTILWAQKLEHKWPSGIFGGILLSVVFILSGLLEFFRGEVGSFLWGDMLPLSQTLFFASGVLIFLFMMWKGHFHVFGTFFISKRS